MWDCLMKCLVYLFMLYSIEEFPFDTSSAMCKLFIDSPYVVSDTCH